MTGTIDLSIEQLDTINRTVGETESNVIRLVIHPRRNQAVEVEQRSLSYGDVLTHSYGVERNGKRVTADTVRDLLAV